MFEDLQNKWSAIDVMGITLMGQPRLMQMMNGFVLQGIEVGNFPRLVAMFLHDDGKTANEPDEVMQTYVNRAIEQVKENRKSNEKVYSIPSDLLQKKYRGCGNGIAVIDKETNKVVDFDYTDSKLRPLLQQNINMSKSAGKKIRETDKTITYRANFSSCQVCLF